MRIVDTGRSLARGLWAARLTWKSLGLTLAPSARLRQASEQRPRAVSGAAAPYPPADALTGPDEPGRRAQPCIHILGCPADQPETWFGTDGNSFDIFSRTVHGARISLWVGFVTAGAAMVIGGTLGAIAAYAGGGVDN